MGNNLKHILDRLREARRHPRAVIARVRDEPLFPFLELKAQWILIKNEVTPVDFVTRLFPEVKPSLVKSFFAESKEDSFMSQYTSSHIWAATLYSIVRLLSPDIAVETGVDAGLSSAFILSALSRNGKGKLYSIDLPVRGFVEDGLRYSTPEGRELGWLIPDHLRTRWSLILGRTQDILVSLLQKLGSIALFLHDSSHLYSNMRFEYENAWLRLKPGGALLSHDVSWPYLQFCRRLDCPPFRCSGMGGIRKPPQPDLSQGKVI